MLAPATPPALSRRLSRANAISMQIRPRRAGTDAFWWWTTTMRAARTWRRPSRPWAADRRRLRTRGRRCACSQTKPPDLVCSDLRMPGMDGLEFLDLLRVHSPDLPCVVVSACGEASALAEARRLGVTAFLRKPVKLEELQGVLGALVAVDGAHAAEPVGESCGSGSDQRAAADDQPRPLGSLNAHLLRKTTQLSLLTRFASVLRETIGSHAAGSPSSSFAGLSASLVQQSLETTRRALGAEQAALCLVEDGGVRPVAVSGEDATPLPVAEAATRLCLEHGDDSWNGVVGGAPIVASSVGDPGTGGRTAVRRAARSPGHRSPGRMRNC